MGELYYEIELNGNRNKAKVQAFLDTGSTYNIIGYELSDGSPTLNIGVETYSSKGAEILLPNTEKEQTFGTVRFKSITISGFTITDPKFTTFTLMRIGEEAIIGHPLMQYLGMILNLRKDKATITRF
ncbi:MAG: hypothetical protein AMDU5_GPLC00004G0286 [Thermoplasmatales archaeon Gpl]|jgi:hypothetical protein|nr:MAG: hypothetical protein AMDU5_GPLC00004G0286 [Thermoplasmatales archaeon Gpl]